MAVIIIRDTIMKAYKQSMPLRFLSYLKKIWLNGSQSQLETRQQILATQTRLTRVLALIKATFSAIQMDQGLFSVNQAQDPQVPLFVFT